MKLKAFLIMLILPFVAIADDSSRIDGNWWMHTSSEGKLYYIVGYWDGKSEGTTGCNSSWIMSSIVAPKACVKFLQDTFSNQLKLENNSRITAGQLKEGLDEFYADYKNRLIIVSHALNIVSQLIEGQSIEKLQKSIETWRQIDSK